MTAHEGNVSHPDLNHARLDQDHSVAEMGWHLTHGFGDESRHHRRDILGALRHDPGDETYPDELSRKTRHYFLPALLGTADAHVAEEEEL